MTVYAAEVDQNAEVLRVLVAPSVGWCELFFGGVWIETSDPYIVEPQTVAYCGPGHHYDPGVAERFVGDEWTQEKATTPDPDDGSYFYATQGQLTWYDAGTGARAWRNLLPTGSPNVFPPPTNWREYPMGAEHPLWVQPTGAFDAYPAGFVVEHNAAVWESVIDANTTEPGLDDRWWREVEQ